MVDSLEYFDAPNYQAIYQLMRRALQNCGQPEFPYGGSIALFKFVQKPVIFFLN